MPWAILYNRLDTDKIVSATRESTLVVSPARPGAANIGQMTVQMSGMPTTSLNKRIEIVNSGDLKTATYKLSDDGGTNFKGRRVDTEWDNGTGGAAGTEGDLTWHYGYVSRPILGSDGEHVMLCEADPAYTKFRLLRSLSMEPNASWTEELQVATDKTVSDAAPALVMRDEIYYAFVLKAGYLECHKIIDGVAEKLALVEMDPHANTKADALILATKLIAVCYVKSDGTYDQVYVKTTADGITYSAAKKVTAETADCSDPTIIQEADGKTVVFYKLSGVGIKARETTHKNPAHTAATWAAYSETLWAAVSTHARPSATIAPDGTIYVAMDDTASGNIVMSKFKDGDSNYSAVSNILDHDGTASHPSLGCIGGHLLVCYDHGAVGAFMATKYWTTYAAGNESWTGTGPQYLGHGVLGTFVGKDAKTGDTVDIDAYYQFAKESIWSDSPSDTWRSTEENVDNRITWDYGSGRKHRFDAFLVVGNVREIHAQANDTDVWTAPSLDEEISLVYDSGHVEAVDGDSVTVDGIAKTWPDKMFAAGGWKMKMTSGTQSGEAYAISDNGDGCLRFGAEVLTGIAAGDTFELLAPGAYKIFTGANKRFGSVLIPAQKVSGAYYELGLAVPLSVFQEDEYLSEVNDQLKSPNEIVALAGGRKLVNPIGGKALRTVTIEIERMPRETGEELLSILYYMGINSAPIVWVPDTTDRFNYCFGYITAVTPVRIGELGAYSFSITIEEQP